MGNTTPIISIAVSLALLCVHAQDCGEFCSGKLPGYLGPLDTAAQIRDALEKSAFKKEVIIFSETRVEPASQFIARYLRAGYKHVLAVMGTPADCHQLHRLFAPTAEHHGNISCGYYRTHDDQGVKYPADFEYLAHGVGRTCWWLKWYTAARAVALGYNVMAVDQDTLPLGDWYGIIKSPPMSSYTMISQCEGGLSINGGFSYIQNANPEGPVAWLLFEALHRAVRFAESPAPLGNISAKLLAYNGGFDMEDQTMLTMAMQSCIAGRPQFPILLRIMPADDPGWQQLGGREAYDKAYGDLVDSKGVWQILEAEGKIASLARRRVRYYGNERYPSYTQPLDEGKANFTVLTAPLYMPHCSDGEWPKALGGYKFLTVDEPGPRTRAYRQSFKDLGVPLPPDPEDPATQQKANNTKAELFGLVSYWTSGGEERSSDWIESTWINNGRHGLWHAHLHPPLGLTGMGHIHAGLMPSWDNKAIILKLSGHYAWDVAARLYGGPERVFYATQLDDQGRSALARIVAYAPGVIHYQLSKEQYLRALEQLARVAVALGAVAAWPAVDCSSDWALASGFQNLSRPVRHSIPWGYLNTSYAVHPFGGSLETLQCEWTGLMEDGCLSNGYSSSRGLLALEFHHLQHQQRHLPEELRRPNRDNTIRLESNLSSPPGPLSAQFQRVSFADLLTHNAEAVLHGGTLEYGNTLWLDRLVEVEGLRGNAEKKYNEWRTRCPGLRYHELQRPDRWRRLQEERQRPMMRSRD